jgi:hypothetical protein
VSGSEVYDESDVKNKSDARLGVRYMMRAMFRMRVMPDWERGI